MKMPLVCDLGVNQCGRAQARDYIHSRESVSERNVGMREGTLGPDLPEAAGGFGARARVSAHPSGPGKHGKGKGCRGMGFQEGSGLTSPLPIPSLSPPKWARSPFPEPLCHSGRGPA